MDSGVGVDDIVGDCIGVGVGDMFALAFMFALLAFAFVVEGAFVLFALALEFLLPFPQSRRRTAVLSTTVRAISLNI